MYTISKVFREYLKVCVKRCLFGMCLIACATSIVKQLVVNMCTGL